MLTGVFYAVHWLSFCHALVWNQLQVWKQITDIRLNEVSCNNSFCVGSRTEFLSMEKFMLRVKPPQYLILLAHIYCHTLQYMWYINVWYNKSLPFVLIFKYSNTFALTLVFSSLFQLQFKSRLFGFACLLCVSQEVNFW